MCLKPDGYESGLQFVVELETSDSGAGGCVAGVGCARAVFLASVQALLVWTLHSLIIRVVAPQFPLRPA